MIHIILNFSCIIFRIRKLKLQNYSTALVTILSCTKLIIEINFKCLLGIVHTKNVHQQKLSAIIWYR